MESHPKNPSQSHPSGELLPPESEIPAGESLPSNPIECRICFEDIETGQIIAAGDCGHTYCSHCITKHVNTAVFSKNEWADIDGGLVLICPLRRINCSGFLDVDASRGRLPEMLVAR
ncbi:uncharacterized protein LOC127239791 [Andrographis paniculata]|uniref:uncharacterized protein LOC127239791 n=1 Tax=Andrographis paniculata TaxID=175694 RepID=UPI0021E7D87A|nr:uncharacterized protein LOC127239791 [Andrographis paniculata]